MAPDDNARPIHQIRYSTRAVTDEAWIRALLQRASACSLATVHGGQPFINITLFVYDVAEHAIYMHSAQVGRTRTNVEQEERVCLGVYEMGRLLPANEALKFDVEYASVIVFGRASIVSDPEEARRALQMLLDKYCPHLRPGDDYRAITPEEIARTTVYRLQIEHWSGKQTRAPADFPCAFHYGQSPM